MNLWVYLLLGIIVGTSSTGAKPPVEIGTVTWERDLDAALATSKTAGKPVFLLFQEVPGCATCGVFGQQVLSHPLLVEAIEDLFIPVLTYNNRQGHDALILKEYREPSWNFPVVRYLDEKGKDLIPRKDRVWEVGETVRRMIAALHANSNAVPVFLQGLNSEYPKNPMSQATFGMFCFWEGEAKLGTINGVLGTRAGWLKGSEVVEMQYDPSIVTYETLLAAAEKMNCSKRIFTNTDEQLAIGRKHGRGKIEKNAGRARDAKPSDQKYALRQTVYRYLPLTPFQQTKINSAISQRQDPRVWLSPRQQAILGSLNRLAAESPSALARIGPPEDSSRLANYHDKLVKLLNTAGMDD